MKIPFRFRSIRSTTAQMPALVLVADTTTEILVLVGALLAGARTWIRTRMAGVGKRRPYGTTMRLTTLCVVCLVSSSVSTRAQPNRPSQKSPDRVIVNSGGHRLEAGDWTIDETMKVRNVENVRLSPDGRRVLFAVRSAQFSGDEGEYLTQIYTANADGTNGRPLTGSDYSATGAEWSPDGRWVAFLSDQSGKSEGSTLWLIAASGGKPRPIEVGGTGLTHIRWSPDGTKIAFVMPVPATPAQAEAQRHPRAPQVVDASHRNLQLRVIGIAPDGTTRGVARALSPDTINVWTRAEFGNPFLLGNPFDWSPDGSTIVFAHGLDFFNNWPSMGISLVDVAGGQIKPLVPSKAIAPSFSPDGRWVAYLATVERSALHNLDVCIISASGGPARTLAPTFDRQPTLIGWSANGAHVYVAESRRTFSRLSALPVTGGPARDIDPGDAVLDAFALDPSRTMIAFTRETLTQPREAHVARLDGFQPVQVSRVNGALPPHPLPRTDLVRWTSFDGAEIEGLLTYPIGYESGRRYPLMVAVHAGGVAFQQTFLASPFLTDTYPVTELALRGYAVLRCNQRGGVLPGYGPAHSVPWFRVKDKAHHDVMAGVDRAIQLRVADGARVGIGGLSNGGLVTAWVITQTPRFKAAIVNAGFPNLIAAATTNPWISRDLGAEPWENLRPYVEYSPLFQLGSVTTPTLILHGEQEEAVPISQGYGLYRALKRRGVPTEMVVYPGKTHVVTAPKHLVDMGRRQVEWMDRHLRDTPSKR